MPLPRPTEEERIAFYDWFTANGVDPRTVPQHTDLDIRTEPDGTRTIHYQEYVLTEDGAKQIEPDTDDSVWTRPATALCRVEPPAWLINPYVRLRRLPGDARLHITHDGRTEAGYLAGARAEATDLILRIGSSDPTLPGATTADAIRVPSRRILLADVHELGQHVGPFENGFRQLLSTLDSLLPHMSEATAPPCGHEDVIETPEFGNPHTPGICMWCPTPLVRLNQTDEWIPA